MKDYIFKNGVLQKAVPYLDSFPFPYYIVLRNIEALPRTLADLLRQVFPLLELKLALTSITHDSYPNIGTLSGAVV